MTGIAFQDVETGVKRLDLFRQIVPGMKRLAVIFRRGSGSSDESLQSFEVAARAMGLDVLSLEVKQRDDFAAAVAAAKAWGAQGVFQSPAFYTTPVRRYFMEQVTAAGLPAACEGRHYVEDGCFMSYNASFEAAFRDSAKYVERVLKGAKPADMPVEQAHEFEFVVNEKVARARYCDTGVIRSQVTEVIR